MKPIDIPIAEIELLANSEGLKAIFEDIERDAFEELLRLPFWASRKRHVALIQRALVVRDVQSRIKSLRALKKRSAGQG